MKKLYKMTILIVAIALLATTTMFVLADGTGFYDEGNYEELESPYVIDVTGMFDHLFEPIVPTPIDASFFDTMEEYAQFREAERLMIIQAPAVEAYGRLMGHFHIIVDGFWQLVFPDNYAGAYVDYDTLVIQLTDISDEVIAFYTGLVGHGAPIAFKQVEFSVNEVMDFGLSFIDTIDVPVVSFGYDTMRNSFLIVLNETAVESVAFYETFSLITMYTSIPVTLELSEPINWVTGEQLDSYVPIEPYNVPVGSFLGGQRIARLNLPAAGFSLGISGQIRPSFNNQPSTDGLAILTAGHPFTIGFPELSSPRGVVVSLNGQRIGVLESFNVSGRWGGEFQPTTANGNWAIIRLDHGSRFGVTNWTQTGARLMGTAPSPPVGSLVRGTGQITHSFHGTVTAVNQITREDPRFYFNEMFGMTRVRPTVAVPSQGDSGGTVYQIFGGVEARFAGIFAGVSQSNWYFTPAITIMPYFVPRVFDGYVTW